MKYCFGADIGGTTVKLGLFGEDGTLVTKWEIPTRTENGGEKILPDIAESIKETMERRQITDKELLGIGVDVPGPVSADGSVPHTANIGWGYKAVTAELEELTGLPCTAGNDANVAALGEMWMGSAKGRRNVLMITLGTGVGGGIIVDGRILNGAHGAGGEIGHFHVSDDLSEYCGCGNQGCLEQFASATGIARLAREAVKRHTGEGSLLGKVSLEDITAKTVFDAVKEGDALAMGVADEFGRVLGSAVAAMTAVIDPEIIVIGGGVSKAGQAVIDCIKKHYVPRAYKSAKDTPIVTASLGNDAGIYGCAKLVLG